MITTLRAGLAAGAAFSVLAGAAAAMDLRFYFPVAVGGEAAAQIEALTQAYMEENPGIRIEAIYTGTYADTTTRAITAARGGNPPHLAILSAVDVFMMLEEDIIEPWNDHLTEEEVETWIGGFYEAFLANSTIDGVTWGIPFQRSTPVMYWNKEAFEAAGLDPERPPETWDELAEMGRALTIRDENGTVTQWGVRIPTSGFPYWLFQGLTTPNGVELMNAEGTEVYFDLPEVVEALEFLVALSAEHEVMAPGIIDWGATPRAFMDGESAIAWTTTGNLTNIRTNAPFEFGVAMLPKRKQRGAPTGGGDFFLFSGHDEETTRAAIDFVKWATAPEQAARWAIETGYVAPRPDTWETEEMRRYVEEVPQALVARDQLAYAVAELSTFENARVRQILNDAIAAAVTGEMAPAEALAAAQREADAVLAPFR
jgi:sn-glycerol 3-phosphate transport system substrate-binding protein